jgi:hypothetical protein
MEPLFKQDNVNALLGPWGSKTLSANLEAGRRSPP